MADVFMLGGATLDLAATDALPIRFHESLGRVPYLTIQRRGIHPPPEATDPWMGRTLTWTLNSTLYFSGIIRSRTLHRDGICGWVISYQAIGNRDLMDRFPNTDKTTGLDTSPFNQQPEDLINYSAARAGRTVGQILTDVLTSTTNANNLNTYGLGNFTGLPSAPALPAATVTDLAALTVIPPRPCYVTGEKFSGAIDGFLQRYAPNVRMWVQPNGTIRFINLLTPASTSTLTMGQDPIEPVELNRDTADCFQRVLVRGAPLAVMFLLKLSLGTLAEDFAWGANDNTAAKAAWTANDFKGTAKSQDSGTCSCPSTTTVTVTSSNSAATWAANYWDQTATGVKGTLNLSYSAGTGITSMWTARIVANTALSAGGTSTLTIDAPLPVTTYNKYTISGLRSDASLVWRKYKIVDTTLWPLVVAQSTYPQPFVNAGGGATMTSSPMGAVLWPQSGSSPPYNQFPLPFVYDGNGRVIFVSPTYIVAQNAAPADVWALLPINTGPNQVASPVDIGGTPQFAGTSYTIEGFRDTLIVTMSDWRDPGQKAQVQAYADDLLGSVKDGIVEGQVTYHGAYESALAFGKALNIAGKTVTGGTDTTGWEAAALPIVGVDWEWPQGADDYLTTIALSTRRAHYSAEMFLRPERRGLSVGLAEGGDVLMLGGATAYGGDAAEHAYAAAADQQPGAFDASSFDPTGGLNFGGSGASSAPSGRNGTASREPKAPASEWSNEALERRQKEMES